MKKFLSHLFFLGLFFSVLISVTFMICFRRSSRQISWKFEPSKTILVTGDSYPECALNDSILSEAVNLSSSADTYIYSYVKIRKFILHNPQIRTVILGFSDHNLQSSDDSFFKNASPGIAKFIKYYYLMEGEEFCTVLKANYNIVFKSLGSCYLKTAFLAFTSFNGISYERLFLGGYRRLSVNKVAELLSEIKNPTNGNHETIGYSQVQIQFLNKIMQHCKEKNIRLILLNVPVHPEFQKKMKNERTFFDQFCRQHKLVGYLWDYADYSLPDSCYADPEHLNYRGAEHFSEMIRKEMEALKGKKEVHQPKKSEQEIQY